jgi:hypothetical protein
MTMDEKTLKDAVSRVGKTSDGKLFRLFLQRRLMTVVGSENSGALLAHNGERRFAHELIALMDEGNAEPTSDRRDGNEQHVSLPKREPAAGQRRRGLERRVEPDEPSADK